MDATIHREALTVDSRDFLVLFLVDRWTDVEERREREDPLDIADATSWTLQYWYDRGAGMPDDPTTRALLPDKWGRPNRVYYQFADGELDAPGTFRFRVEWIDKKGAKHLSDFETRRVVRSDGRLAGVRGVPS